MAKNPTNPNCSRPDEAAPTPSGTRTDSPAPAPRPPPREPVFWFGFEVAWAKLAVFRFVLFGLLAVDAFLQLHHAPRYFAGGFNVGHFPFLDGIGPGRTGYEVGQLLETYLFALAALGIATRLVLPIAAALYAWLYFGSQLDSYQHHYLVALLVVIACFVPWERPPDATPATRVRTWAVRLILVELGIMYLWTAISKMDPAWTSGRTLGGQLTGALRTTIDGTLGMQAAAILVIVLELVLAATIWLRPAWKIAAPLGLVFHLGIAQSGLEIGLFAYLMLAMYLLLLPDALFLWLADAPPLRSLQTALGRLARSTSWVLWALALAAGLGAGALLRLEHGLLAALLASAIPAALAARALLRGRAPVAALGAAHLAAVALWLAADHASSVAVDYYRYWAGSQRRLGDLATAEYAYRRLVDVAPDLESGHYYLGKILTSDGREEGVAHLREAQRLAPRRARAWMQEARWLASQGQHAEALAKAREAVSAEPSKREARTLLKTLTANRPAPATTPEDDDLEQL
jgi:tetratricopeptide (TPR) repeat protein